MKRIFTIMFVAFALTTFSQVTITKSDISNQLSIGANYTSYQDTSVSTLDIGTAGENSWDFSSLTSDFLVQTSNIDPSSAPENDKFSGPTSVVHSTATIEGITIDTWTFTKIETGKADGLGFHIESTGGPAELYNTTVYDPPEMVYELPLTYNATWTDTGTRDIEMMVGGFPNNSTEDYTITKTVDAYGTLIMPDGTTEEDVLRITVESDFTSTVMGIPNTTHNLYYEFISKSGLYLEVNAADYQQPPTGNINVVDVSWHYEPTTTGIEDGEELATSFSLKQNYPNPFNPTTNIEYSIPNSSNVTLKVYDVLGNEVETLVDQKQSPGVYNAKFDGSNLSSGIYFYTLTAGDFVQTKKLMLVK